MPRPPSAALRWVAGLTSAAMAGAVLAWLIVAVLGLSSFYPTRENDGCWQPQVPYGVALMALAVCGVVAALWTLRAAVPVVRARRDDPRFLGGIALFLGLAGAFVIVAVPLNPDGHFAPC